ncbi:hypothetical protein [Bradyrhizobium sp. 170]|uniref:hypothetical protein n=1 Tax=Bradyrhizobium sp. 170 TaxID=2782641 RepID=UPI001FFF3C70|nr:hypothetical protein [Bradyrhizobium sp. 170]UPK03088.1 hypothetical protein IVB05_37020 [Bradyrhizobium sp. 170]
MAFEGFVQRMADVTTIPNDPANADWIKYQEWLAAGGVPDPCPASASPLPDTASTLGLKRALEELDLWQTAKDQIIAAGEEDEWYMALEVKREAVDRYDLGLTPEEIDNLMIRSWQLAAKAATQTIPPDLAARAIAPRK